jgi:hypothetical protein
MVLRHVFFFGGGAGGRGERPRLANIVTLRSNFNFALTTSSSGCDTTKKVSRLLSDGLQPSQKICRLSKNNTHILSLSLSHTHNTLSNSHTLPLNHALISLKLTHYSFTDTQVFLPDKTYNSFENIVKFKTNVLLWPKEFFLYCMLYNSM